jgi:tetraacyldisaccharide 4'-kinase
MTFAERLVAAWYASRLTPLTLPLVPLSVLYAGAVALRRRLYRAGVLRARRLPVPVVVIGNITVGGSGKTPLVAALAAALAARGWRPGIVSRGYGRRAGAAGDAPLLVARDSDPALVGDEPVLLARAGLPVAVAADRVAAASALLAAHPECNVILADDGLQHLRLARDVEIAVIDAARGLGNGWRLPAGPLREARSRLATVDAVVALCRDGDRASAAWPGALAMTLAGDVFHRVDGSGITAGADAFRGAGVHALAGIGNPERFFGALRTLGIGAVAHSFPDHHRFSAADLALPGATAILMTEKDAVKCAAFADARCWYLPVTARLDPALVDRIEEKLRGPQAARDPRLPGDQGAARLRP